MTLRSLTCAFIGTGLAFACFGCGHAPGKPGSEPESGRPEQVLSFAPLYKQNCAGCHGDDGKGGAAISLANPVYLAIAGPANIKRTVSAGVPGAMMPAFGKQAGGMLTDAQIDILAQGMYVAWSHPDAMGGAPGPSYSASSPGDPEHGQKTFTVFCARCHGSDAAGIAVKPAQTGSLVDPAYLGLVSDQSLRSAIMAGEPERGMPDWRADLTAPNERAMTDQEITDTVAWIASHRVAMPGQPYRRSE